MPKKADLKMDHLKRNVILISGLLLVLGALAFSYLLGISPQRVYAKIRTSGTELLEEVQREISLGIMPKEKVAGPQNPDYQGLQLKNTAEINGTLRVSEENPRYFSDASGNIVYLTGSHTWLNLIDGVWPDPPPEFDYTGYLDFLVSHNHNFFRLWTWEQAKWSTESAEANYFTPQPYLRTGPGLALDGKPKFDLTQFNQSYFDRMRQRVIEAGDRNIYASVMLFNGWSIQHKGGNTLSQPWDGHPYNENNNINDVDGDLNNDGQGEEIETLQSATILALQEAYVTKVIDTVYDLDNVLYEISNEGPSNSEAWQHHMIQFIKDYEATKPKQHPVGMTVEWPDGNNNDLYNSPADWVSPNGDINNPPEATGSKVVIADTDHLCGICGDRVWVWKSFTRGENPIFMDQYDDSYLLNGGGYDMNNPNDVSLRRNLGYTLTYANRMNLADAEPRGDLCSTGYCLANPTSNGSAEFLVYLPSGGSVTVNLSNVNGSVFSEWLNPATGQVYTGGSTTGGGNRQFTAPFGGDAVLYLAQESQPLPTSTPPAPEFRRFVPFVITSSLDWENMY